LLPYLHQLKSYIESLEGKLPGHRQRSVDTVLSTLLWLRRYPPDDGVRLDPFDHLGSPSELPEVDLIDFRLPGKEGKSLAVSDADPAVHAVRLTQSRPSRMSICQGCPLISFSRQREQGHPTTLGVRGQPQKCGKDDSQTRRIATPSVANDIPHSSFKTSQTSLSIRWTS
jgi:hypothetical protein